MSCRTSSLAYHLCPLAKRPTGALRQRPAGRGRASAVSQNNGSNLVKMLSTDLLLTLIPFVVILSLYIEPATSDCLVPDQAINKSISLVKGNCPTQLSWIFVGVLVGLVVGIFVLWLFNCFNIQTPADQESSVTNNN